MAKRIRRLFSAEFKLEAAQLVLDQNYSVIEAANAMGIGQSTMDKWVRQLKLERKGISPKASPMTPEQVEIRELKKKISRLEAHNEICSVQKNQDTFLTILTSLFILNNSSN